MSVRGNKLAKRIKSFVENPYTNLVKGLTLLMIGLSEASQTVLDDITHRHLRVGHGLIIIGFFSILSAIPSLIEAVQATVQYWERREKNKVRSLPETDHS